MSRRILIAAASLAPSAEAKSKNFYYLKNGTMYSFRAYKLRHNPPLYVALHKLLGLGPQWGLTEYINVPGTHNDPVEATPSKGDYCDWRE